MIVLPASMGLVKPVTGGSAWIPSDLSAALALWVNDDSNVTDAGAGACSEWQDISGNGYHLTQTSGSSRPLIVAAGLNGRRTIRADGTNDFMVNADAGFLDTYRAAGVGCLWCVFKKNATGSTGIRTVWNAPTPTAANVRFAFCSSAVGTDTPQVRVRRQDGDAVAGLNASASIGTEWNKWLVVMDWTNGDCFLYKNDPTTPDASNLALTSSGPTSNTASNVIAMFSNTSGSASAGVEMAEFVTWAGYVPDLTDRTNFMNYGTSRWGV